MTSNEASNLASHRAPARVWDKRGWSGPTIEERVGPWVVSLVGAGLVVYGASHRSWRGAWWIVSGISIIAGACAGFSNPEYARMTIRDRFDRASSDPIATESIDSFPASDAPSSNLAASAGVRSKPLRAAGKTAGGV